jgi:hypothetical protein
MKFPFFKKKKNHLEYASIASWMHGECVPNGFGADYGSGRRPDFGVYVDQYCDLRQHLFDKHVRTLPDEIQKQLKSGQHPSQSHEKIKQAEPVLQRLKEILSGLDFIKDVSIKNGQMGFVQFDVTLKKEPIFEQAEMVPEYFEGYVVNTRWTSNG